LTQWKSRQSDCSQSRPCLNRLVIAVKRRLTDRWLKPLAVESEGGGTNPKAIGGGRPLNTNLILFYFIIIYKIILYFHNDHAEKKAETYTKRIIYYTIILQRVILLLLNPIELFVKPHTQTNLTSFLRPKYPLQVYNNFTQCCIISNQSLMVWNGRRRRCVKKKKMLYYKQPKSFESFKKKKKKKTKWIT